MHCIIVLATLFVTSCYWSAVPANTISPEVLNRLNITLTNSTDPQWVPFNAARELKWDQPVQLLSRCWCDFTRTPFFHNLDVRTWEKDSVFAHPMPTPLERSPPLSEPGGVSNRDTDVGFVPVSELDTDNKNAAPGLTRRLLGYVVPKRFLGQSPPTPSPSSSITASTSAATSRSASSVNNSTGGGGFMQRWRQKGGGTSDKPAAAPSPCHPAHISNTNPATVTPVAPPPSPPEVTPPTPSLKSIFRPLFFPSILLRPITHWRFRWPSKATGKVQGPKLPWLRRRYDLRRHGVGIVLDFGWGYGESGEPIGPA
jgi:hypothetical protein